MSLTNTSGRVRESEVAKASLEVQCISPVTNTTSDMATLAAIGGQKCRFGDSVSHVPRTEYFNTELSACQ